MEFGASPGGSFVIIGEGGKPETSFQLKPTNPTSEDLRLMAKRIELPPFRNEDPYGWISRAKVYFAMQRILIGTLTSADPDLYRGNALVLVQNAKRRGSEA